MSQTNPKPFRARICKWNGDKKAFNLLFSADVPPEQKAVALASFHCPLDIAKVTKAYRTEKRLLRNAIPTLGCWRVDIFKNPLATYAGIAKTLIIANGKIIEEFEHE